jgi:hypothetical protein
VCVCVCVCVWVALPHALLLVCVCAGACLDVSWVCTPLENDSCKPNNRVVSAAAGHVVASGRLRSRQTSQSESRCAFARAARLTPQNPHRHFRQRRCRRSLRGCTRAIVPRTLHRLQNENESEQTPAARSVRTQLRPNIEQRLRDPWPMRRHGASHTHPIMPTKNKNKRPCPAAHNVALRCNRLHCLAKAPADQSETPPLPRWGCVRFDAVLPRVAGARLRDCVRVRPRTCGAPHTHGRMRMRTAEGGAAIAVGLVRQSRQVHHLRSAAVDSGVKTTDVETGAFGVKWSGG